MLAPARYACPNNGVSLGMAPGANYPTRVVCAGPYQGCRDPPFTRIHQLLWLTRCKVFGTTMLGDQEELRDPTCRASVGGALRSPQPVSALLSRGMFEVDTLPQSLRPGGSPSRECSVGILLSRSAGFGATGTSDLMPRVLSVLGTTPLPPLPSPERVRIGAFTPAISRDIPCAGARLAPVGGENPGHDQSQS